VSKLYDMVFKEQARVPAGSSEGGQWAGSSGGMSFDKRVVEGHLRSGSFSSNKFDKKGVGVLYDAVQSGKEYKILETSRTDYGVKLAIEVDGRKHNLTKAAVRHSDVKGYFGEHSTVVSEGVTRAERKLSHSDPYKLKPTSAAGSGERVQLADNSVWEYSGISGYQTDNRNRVNGWQRVP